MAEENNIPKADNTPDLLRVRMAGAGNLDPIDPDIVKAAPLQKPSIPRVPGIKPLDPQFLPSGLSIEGVNTPKPTLSPITSEGLRAKMQQLQIDGVDVKSDPWKFGKRMMADLHDPNNQNQFYDRYAAHSDFKKLGFSPFRDNESLYNANSSWWNEMGRAHGEFATLVGLGFKDAFGFGDLTDMETAAKFEKAMAIGTSTKGGIGGFTTNLFLNSGYTVGIMAELAAEEIAMAAAEFGLGVATGASLGTASPLTLPAMGVIGARMGTKAVSAFNKIGKAWGAAKNIGKALDNLKDINKARGFFYKAGAKTLDVLNPLENTVDFFKNMDNMGDISKVMKTAKGFGEFYKDIRNVRLAYGEGALEGGMVRNQITRDLISEFEATHDRPMTDAEAAKIHMAAKVAGTNTALVNMPLILLSNKMTFDGLVRGKFKNMGQTIIKTGQKGKILFDPKKAKEAFSAVPKNYFKAKWAYIKNPRNLLSGGLTYAKANIAEGLQELGQDVVSKTFTDYEMAKYNGDPVRGGHYSFLANALSEQVSLQGAETFLSGFLMGGFVAPISNTVASTVQNRNELNNIYKRVFKNEEWQEIRNKRDAQLAQDINKLNKFYEDPRQYLNPDLENVQSQKEYQNAMGVAQENNDRLGMEDAMDSSMIDHVTTALHLGRFDSFIERLEDMKGLTAEEAAEMDPSKSHQDFITGVTKSIDKANNIKKRYDYFAKSKTNPFNPLKYKKDSDEYYLEARKQHAWNSAVNEAVFYQSSFDRALERQTDILGSLQENAGLKNTPFGEFSLVTDFKSTIDELGRLSDELKVLDENSTEPAVRKAVKDKKKKQGALKEYADAVEDMLKNMGENESIPDEQYNKLEKAYKGYINYLNEKNGDFSTVDNVDKSLRSIIDWYRLDGRKKASMDAVNTLLDPQGFLSHFDRKDALNELKLKQKKAEIEKSLKAYREKQESNQMLNALADEGMFFDVSDLAKLEEEGIAPKEFYYTNTEGNKDDQVVRNTDDYMKAVRILQKFVAVTKGIDITNESKFNPYSGQSRQKSKEDKRTYEDLAKQFGFNPTETNTEVPLKKVLQAIIDSEFATKAEVELAKKLLEQADDKEFVTFSNRESQPGSYTEIAQTVIDARYSADNYKHADNGHPLEFIILREEIGRRVQQKLEEDQEFKSQIESLREEALAKWNTLTPEEKTAFFSGPFDVLTPQEFAKAAMTNERFQIFLASVSSKMETKSVWQKFVDAVLNALEKSFGVRPNGTVLNAALDVITSKINLDPITPGSSSTTTTTSGRQTSTSGSSRTMNFAQMTQDQFAEYLQENHADALSREQIYSLLTVRPELREAKLKETDEQWAKRFELNKEYREQTNRIANDKDMSGASNPGWTGISVNDPTNKEANGRQKGYVTVKADKAKEFGLKIEDHVKELYRLLKEAGYNGHLKVPTGMSDLLLRFDNIVLHGATKQDVDLALQIVSDYLNNNGITVESTKTGVDVKDSNGKETSHTDALAEKVKNKQLTVSKKPAPATRPKPSSVPAEVKAAQRPANPRSTVGGKMIPALRALGYSEQDIKNFSGSPSEAQRIIDNVIYKEDLIAEAEEAKKDTSRDQDIIDLRLNISKQLKLVADTMDYSVWMIVDMELQNIIRENPEIFEETGYTVDILREEMLTLKQEIQEKPIIFEELKEGDYLVMNFPDEPVAEIIDVQDDYIVLEYTNINRTVKVTKEELNDRVKFNFRNMQSQEESVPEVTEEEIQNIKDSEEVIQTPAEQMKALVEDAKNSTENDLFNDLLDSTC